MKAIAETGKKQKVAINGDVILDFEGLFDNQLKNDTSKAQDEQKAYRDTTKQGNAFKGLKNAPDGKGVKTTTLHRSQDPKNISPQLQAEIIEGLQTGEDIYSLFLKAAQAISIMTADGAFLAQARAGAETHRKLKPLHIGVAEARKVLDRHLRADISQIPSDKEKQLHYIITFKNGRVQRQEATITEAD